MKMSNVKAQSSNQAQNPNEQKKFLGIQSFGIHLTFELWHLEF
jgi:hypothetical protein